MKKLTKNLITFLTLACFSQCAFSYTLSNEELNKIIYSKVQKETSQKLLNISSDFKINITGIPFSDIKTNENIIPKVEIKAQDVEFKPNSFNRVVVKDSKNNILKAFSINVQTLVYKNVLVANDLIAYNSEINLENTKLARKEVSKNLSKIMTELPKGAVSNKNFQKESLILSDCIKQKASIEKNSIVDIVFQSEKGLRIKMQGYALKAGSIGEIITVRSDKYNKIYNAKVSSSSEVVVRI